MRSFSFRPAILVAAVWLALILVLLILVLWPQPSPKHRAQNQALVAHLGLTDLALFTDARYSRHPSQADWHAPFQDHPGALEHFPSGALVMPAEHLHDPLARKTSSPN